MIRADGRLAALARLALAAACALALSGCISLLPNAKPSQLYRFEYRAAAAPGPAGAAGAVPLSARTDVYLANGSFPQEAASDQILTQNGARVAYIAASRWVAPAVVLWDQAVHSAFEATSGQVRLISRGEPASSAYALRLDVLTFETDYADDTPTVRVRVHATLTRTRDRQVIAEQTFEARAPAQANRVTAITEAYNRAVAEVLNAVVAWTANQATLTT
jgi:cholesterol transport system auxiliary component